MERRLSLDRRAVTENEGRSRGVARAGSISGGEEERMRREREDERREREREPGSQH